MKIIPYASKDLIAELEEMFPPRCVDPGDTLASASRYAGSVELVQTLRARLKWTEQNATPAETLNRNRNY